MKKENFWQLMIFNDIRNKNKIKSFSDPPKSHQFNRIHFILLLTGAKLSEALRCSCQVQPAGGRAARCKQGRPGLALISILYVFPRG